MADQPHAEVCRQPEEGRDGHDDSSVINGISEDQADTTAALTSTMNILCRERVKYFLLSSGPCSKFSGWLPGFL